MAGRGGGQRLATIGWTGLALLAVLLLIATLLWGGWRSGLLAVRANDIGLRLPATPGLPRVPSVPMPDPQPAPLPRPGPRAQA
ncbi:hypothetical protein BH10PSE4_BH10PSE4_17710 [soil metagenome]